MTKSKALELNYCKYCASFVGERQLCGVTIPPELKDDQCIMPVDVQDRFKLERGLEGETKREIRGDFGDRELMKKPLRRRKKRKW